MPGDQNYTFQEGFLAREPPTDLIVHGASAEHRLVLANILAFAQAGSLRARIRALREIEVLDDQLTENDRKALFALLSVLASAFVNGGAPGQDGPVITLPRCLAVPLDRLARYFDRNPIIDYTSIVLNNWQLKDRERPFALDNLKVIWSFTKKEAEEWFYLIHVVIESHGAGVMKAAKTIADQTGINAISQKDRLAQIIKIKNALESLRDSMKEINKVVNQLEEKCSPEFFFDTLRPWLSGWDQNGVIYEGVSEQPLKFSGGSGAQSSLFPSLDAIIGIVRHRNYEFNDDLSRMRKAMPPADRKTIEFLEASKSVEAFISDMVALVREQPSEELVTALKDLINLTQSAAQEVGFFRDFHIKLTHRYIMRMANRNAPMQSEEQRGTGGLRFQVFLKKQKEQVKTLKDKLHSHLEQLNQIPDRIRPIDVIPHEQSENTEQIQIDEWWTPRIVKTSIMLVIASVLYRATIKM